MSTFHLATGESQNPDPEPEQRPTFHPAIGYTIQENS